MVESRHPPIEPDPPARDEISSMRLMSRAVGAGLFLSIVAGAIWISGDFEAFLHLPSPVFVLGGSAALLLLTFGHDGCWTALRLTVAGGRMAEHGDALRRGDPVTFFRLAAAYAFLTGLCGTLIGIIQMLSNVGNPAMIGSGLALALLTQFYGVLLAVLCIGLAAFGALRYPHETKLRHSTRLVVPAAAAAATVGTAASVGITMCLWLMML